MTPDIAPASARKPQLTLKQRAFLEALAKGNLSASTGNPPVLKLAKAGLIRFLHRSEDFSVMTITDAGRAALARSEGQ